MPRRTLKYLPGHRLRFGVAAVARDADGRVLEAECLFCRHFGREQRADKKRRAPATLKRFRDSFRPDQYTQHLQLQHPTQWRRYKSCTDEEKLQFFNYANTGTAEPEKHAEGTRVAPPRAEERGRCFDLKAEIVEVVAVLAVGLGPVESSVRTRDRQMYQYMTHHNYEEQPKADCPLWSPPPHTFESCSLLQKKPPVYRVMVYSKSQMDFLVKMAAEGLSSAQIARSVNVCRRHALTLLNDVVGNSEKADPTSKRNVAMAVERAEEQAKKRLRVEDMTPAYTEEESAEFVRLGIAASLSIIARLLEKSWVFSLELKAFDQQSLLSYLDVRVKFYSRVSGLCSAHLLAIPKYVGKCDVMMFQTLDRVLTALLPEWRERLIGITTGGDIPITARIIKVVKRFQNVACGPMFYRNGSSIDQLHRILYTFYAALDKGRFFRIFKRLSDYVRNEPSVLSEIKRYPGYREQLDSEMQGFIKSPTAFGREVDMIMVHNGMIQTHFQEKAPAIMLAPPVSWWVTLEVLQWATGRANAVFEVLQKQYLSLSQQAAVMTSLAEECISGFNAQLHDGKSSSTRSTSDTLVSRDGQVSLGKSTMLDFVVGSSTIARDLMKHGSPATVHSVAENLAASAVDMVASLVELSDSLKQQSTACVDTNSTKVSQASTVTDVLPPVLPHELAQLSLAEFDEVLQAHDAAQRGTLTNSDIKAICEEHELLCRLVAKEEEFRCALEKCTQETPFDLAWSFMDARFGNLEAFAGGLATVRPSDAVALSDQKARDVVVCPKDMEEARLLLADLTLESALHAQQFQSLTKLQEEMYDREVSSKRR